MVFLVLLFLIMVVVLGFATVVAGLEFLWLLARLVLQATTASVLWVVWVGSSLWAWAREGRRG